MYSTLPVVPGGAVYTKFGFAVPGVVGFACYGLRYFTVLVTVRNVFNGIPAMLLYYPSSASMYGVMIANSDFWNVRPDSVPVF